LKKKSPEWVSSTMQQSRQLFVSYEVTLADFREALQRKA
jgi:hypothetical protein